MTDILREIDEDLKKDKLEQVWLKYGPYIFGGAMLILAGSVAAVVYKNKVQEARVEATDQLINAVELIEQDKLDKSETIIENLDSVLAADQSGLSLLAQFQRASLMLKEEKSSEALSIYKEIRTDSSVAERYRDMATVLTGKILLDEGKVAELAQELERISSGNNAWRFSAKELQAMAHIEKDEYTQAIALLSEIKSDPEAPLGMKARATQLAEFYQAKIATSEEN